MKSIKEARMPVRKLLKTAELGVAGMAMDLLLKSTPPVLEEKNLQEGAKVVEEISENEGRRSAMEGASVLPLSPHREADDSSVSNLGLRGGDKLACNNDSSLKTNGSGNQKQFIPMDKAAQLESAKVEMGEVREENERLKTILSQIMNDYQALKMHFFEIVNQEESIKKKTMDQTPAAASLLNVSLTNSDDGPADSEETELVSLSLGNSLTSSTPKRDDQKANDSTNTEISINLIGNNSNNNAKEGDESVKTGLSLGLNSKFFHRNDGDHSPANSLGSEQAKLAEEGSEGWPPNKAAKEAVRSADDDALQPANIKKARVTVRARCDTPTMQDGCQWRKYGQKIAKGNPCPRAYYRCTVAPGCGVRKQVQRCADDMSILITTYEGTHNHPLPLQATAMASTTSAAASMLMSGSSIPPAGASATSGLSFDLSYNSRTRPFYLTSPALSATPAYPTITLDLTSTSSSPQFTRLPSAFSTTTPRYPTPAASLSLSNFSFSTDHHQTAQLPSTCWPDGSANTKSSHFKYYGAQHFNKNIPSMSMSTSSSALTKSPHEQFYQTFSPKIQASSASQLSSLSVSPSSKQNFSSDTIAAATKAITSDPSFRSALAAAITSIVGTNNAADHAPVEVNIAGGQNVKWREQIPAPASSSSSISAYHSSRGGSGMPSFFNTAINPSSSGGNVQQSAGNLFQLGAPPLPFSSAKSSSSASPAANNISGETKQLIP